jgi:hypothetical protein
MIQQISTKTVKSSTIMRSKAFVEGFKSVRDGKPLDYDFYPFDTRAQWNYERGRLLALQFTGSLKFGQKLNWDAQMAYHCARNEKSII